MAKLERKNVKIFASNPNDATQVSAFLTGKNETPDYSSDPDVIQNIYYPKGWLGQGENDLPQVTDMNGVMYTESYKTAYLYQQGIADWIVTQEYAENSFCQVEGVLYRSLVDNNIGNDPTSDDGTNWLEIAFEPYTGENLGNAEGIYAGKTLNNELQFKGLAVTGNGNISASDDTITISIGGGGTGDVYWGAIDGTLSNQSDLQQALNLKQNLIGYTPENIANKVTTVREDTVATDTAYASEKATRTAIDNAITSANNYTDSALQTLNSDAFVLYANSWTDIDTGTLTTIKPTGTGTAVQLTSVGSSYENIATFSYTTTQQTIFNNTFTYDILLPIRNAALKEWNFKIKLTIEHLDVNSGTPTTLVEYETTKFFPPTSQNLNIEIKQDNLNLTAINYPAGSEIKFKIQAKCESNSYNLDLLIYDQTYPLTISRNRSVNQNLVTAFNTQVTGTPQNQEYLNYLLYNNKQDKLSGWNFGYNGTQATQTPIAGITSYIGTSTYPVTSINCGTVNTTEGYINNTISNTVTSDNYKNNLNYTNPTTPFTNFNFGSTYYYDHGTNNEMSILNIQSSYDIDTNTFTEILPQKINSEIHNCNLGSDTQRFWRGYFVNLNTTGNITTTNIVPSTNNTYKVGESNSNYFAESYIRKMYVGEVHIGTGNNSVVWFYTNSDIRFENESSSGTVNVYSGSETSNLGTSSRKWNNVWTEKINGSNYSPSDRDKKENINKRNNETKGKKTSLEVINSLETYTYNYKDDKDKTIHIGIMAQDLQNEIPECVVDNGESNEKGEHEKDLYIDVMGYVTVLTEAVKQLSAKVESLEARVNELEGNKKELEK